MSALVIVLLISLAINCVLACFLIWADSNRLKILGAARQYYWLRVVDPYILKDERQELDRVLAPAIFDKKEL